MRVSTIFYSARIPDQENTILLSMKALNNGLFGLLRSLYFDIIFRINAAKRFIHQSYDPNSSDYDIALFKNSFNTLLLFNLFDCDSINHVGISN